MEEIYKFKNFINNYYNLPIFEVKKANELYYVTMRDFPKFLSSEKECIDTQIVESYNDLRDYIYFDGNELFIKHIEEYERFKKRIQILNRIKKAIN